MGHEESTIVAICGSFVQAEQMDKVSAFVLRQLELMPDFLRFGMTIFTFIFGLAPLLRYQRTFSKLSPAQQQQQIARWRTSKIGPCRDFIKFYESLSMLQFYSLGKWESDAHQF